MPGPWTLEPFIGDDGTVPFERLLSDLSDDKADAVDLALRRVLSVHGIDLVRTEWLKALGDGLHEFRLRHDAGEVVRRTGGDPSAHQTSERVLIRVFVHFHGHRVVLLLGGYDKGRDPSPRRQQREIRAARRLLKQFKERQRRFPPTR